ncbi:hypothetical protein K435DRAFT_720273, partial [Dendrothele bispora CBS 962.96]
MCQHTSGLYGTGQCDGWKNVAKSSLITSMVNTEYNPFLLGVEDVSSKPKTAQTLLEIVVREMKEIQDVFKVILVAWCTDASGESAKMRRDLRKKFPWIVVLDCWAHQINLVVGDVLKIKIPLIRVVDRALELIKWFNNHSIALGLFKAEQLTFRTSFLVLILPVLTRWTSHFLSLDRLCELETAFVRLVASPETRKRLSLCAGPKAEAKRKAQEIIELIRDRNFWKDVESVRDLLRPFAIAVNALQADNCRLDTVLFTLAKLYHIHSQSNSTVSTDRDVFILAVVFNPYIRVKAFNPRNILSTPAGLWNLVRQTFKRFSKGEDPNAEFREHFTAYLRNTGQWSDEGMSLKIHRENAEKRNGYVNLVHVWREFEVEDNVSRTSNGANGMVRMAMRVLSMVPNSAPTERIFSRFGSIHTKIRNRLGAQKVRKMTILGTQIERTYGSASHHQKRNFGNDPITSSIPPTEQTSGVVQPEEGEDEIERGLRELELEVEEEEESPDTGANIAEAAQTNGTDLIPTFDEITQQIMVDHNDSLDGHDSDTEDNDVPVLSEDSYLLKN